MNSKIMMFLLLTIFSIQSYGNDSREYLASAEERGELRRDIQSENSKRSRSTRQEDREEEEDSSGDYYNNKKHNDDVATNQSDKPEDNYGNDYDSYDNEESPSEENPS